MENVLRDEQKRKQLGKSLVDLLADLRHLCCHPIVNEPFTSHTLPGILFPMVHVKPLTLEGFTQIISHPKCNLMFIFPERLRYNFIFENVFIF